MQKIIFKVLDFDGDGKIIPEDSRLLISFIKKIGGSITNIIKLKTKLKKESNDEENLTEINDLISTYFDNKEKMTFEEYKYKKKKKNSDVFFVFLAVCYLCVSPFCRRLLLAPLGTHSLTKPRIQCELHRL